MFFLSHLPSLLQGHIQIVAWLLHVKHVPLVRRSCDGWSPLHVAAYRGHTAMVSMLLSYATIQNARTGGPVGVCSATETRGWTPLHVAAHQGMLEAARLLATSWPEGLHAATRLGATPLVLAVQEGHIDTVRLLHRLGGSSVLSTQALVMACQDGHLHVAQYLYQQGVPLLDAPLPSGASSRCKPSDAAGQAAGQGCEDSLAAAQHSRADGGQGTALSPRACGSESETNGRGAADETVRSGDDPATTAAENAAEDAEPAETAKVGQGQTNPLFVAALHGRLDVVRWLLSKGLPVNAKAAYGWTALHDAAAENHLDVVKCLVKEGGADVNATKNDGCTALYLAAWRGHVAIVKWLLAHGARVAGAQVPDGGTAENATAGALDSSTCPLHISVQQGNVAVAQALLEGSDLPASAADMPDGHWTCLHICAADGNVDMARLLLKHGARPGARNGAGLTPMHVAAWRNQVGVARVLFEEGAADPDLATNDGGTPLIVAAHEGALEAAAYLLDGASARVNLVKDDGTAALHVACRRGHDKMACLLVHHGADVNLADRFGWTSLLLSAWRGQAPLVLFLLEAGADIHHAQNNNATALYMACVRGHLLTAQLLVVFGARLDIRTRRGVTLQQAGMEQPELRDWIERAAHMTLEEVRIAGRVRRA